MKKKLTIIFEITVFALILFGILAVIFYVVNESHNKKYNITLYDNNIILKKWTAIGDVSNMSNGGYRFKDDSTKKYVEIQGTIIIEDK
jgi:hypothetical protein